MIDLRVPRRSPTTTIDNHRSVLHVTMLDISRDVVAAMRATTFKPDEFARILDAVQLRPGGSLECVAGDLMKPVVCPGLYDVVVERKTRQLAGISSAACSMSAPAEAVA